MQAQIFSGTILDKNNNLPLPLVDVYFVDLNTGTTTDNEGVFHIEHFERNKIHIQISYVGYETIDEIIIVDSTYQKTFYLVPAHLELKEVVISASTGKLQRDNIVSISKKSILELQQSSSVTLAEAISNIPGLSQNTTGPGIGKPVIRGLSGNRIVTYAQGIRIENQQWGAEHGLGVGEIGIESVEVIKGPASLLYGSDALGGVLYFVDERYSRHNTLDISAKSKYQSNTSSFSNQLGVKVHKGKLKYNLFGAHSSHSNFKIPNTNSINNTGFNEKNIKSSLGYNTNHWISNIRYSLLSNKFGITEEPYFLSTNSRTITLPFQNINNQNVSFENLFFLKESKLSTTLGYTTNFRQEFEDDTQNQALGMRLNTFTYNLKWNSAVFKKHYSLTIGTQGMVQENKNNGAEILIPDAKTNDFGLFAISNLDYNQLQFLIGLRIDNRTINSMTTSNVPDLDRSFTGFTFSSGLSYKKGKSIYRANLSRGFRAPNTSELLSDGVHEGTNRYETGNRDLINEYATQLDFSYDFHGDHIEFSIQPFYNSISNYIFLSPTGKTIENSPEFEFSQTNAKLFGGEIGMHHHPHSIHWLHIDSNMSAVYAEDKNNNALPLIPQVKLNSTVSAKFNGNSKITSSSIFLQHIHKFKQDRIGQFETPTDSYNLINVGSKIEFKTNANPILFSFGINNLLNNDYIDHLSRFKEDGIPNPGINFYFELAINLSGKIE